MSYGSDNAIGGDTYSKAIDLMDELRRRSRLARRIALATALACCVTHSHADEASSFKSLLKQGWNQDATADSANTSAADETTSPIPQPPALDEAVSSPPVANEIPANSEVSPKSENQADANQRDSAPAATEQATIVRPQLRVLEVPTPKVHAANTISIGALPSAKTATSNTTKLDADPVGADPVGADVGDRDLPAGSLAELIKERTEAVAAKLQESLAEQASDTALSPNPGEIASTQEDVAAADLSDASEVRASPEGPATSAIAEIIPPEAPVAPSPTPSRSVAKDAVATGSDDGIASDSDVAESGLHRFSDIQPDAPIRLRSETNPLSITATIHSTRLRQLARESLHTAKHRLRRQATHSAQSYALKALRAVVAMQDAKSGGNQRAKSLDQALDAIRESQDFCGRFGVIDQKALRRMVTVHETTVLKDQDLENISAIEATEAYLLVAKDSLVAASSGSRDASEALVILGQIETSVSRAGTTHSGSVAVTLHRAAIEVSPGNASGYQALGTTLLSQGLIEQADWALKHSIEIHPSHSAYRKLLDVARRRGDVETARACLATLRSGDYPAALPVQTLSPEVFARTHRPSPATIQPSKPKSVAPVAAEASSNQERVSFRSLFPFSRR